MDVVLIVIDSFGIGALPDAPLYGDEGANTALHICESIPESKWPFLTSLGLGNASEILGNPLPGCPPVSAPLADYCVMAEKSPGKDTTTGHWELAGIILDKPFTTFPPDFPSFPKELTDAFLREVSSGYLGNFAASGTEIIKELGGKHLETGFPIIYTSSDSVLQIASHEDVIPAEKLYEMCRKARKICDPFMVGRVIARPFTGNKKDGFTRTEGRHDFSIDLPGKTALDRLQAAGVKTIGVGKIGDIFNRQGLSESFGVKGNKACLEKTLSLLSETQEKDKPAGKENEDRFIFVNLVDTDMYYGHRRDVKGYFDAVTDADKGLEEIASLLDKGDSLIVTADHGCDPSFKGTDHTREYVPLLLYTKDGNTGAGESAPCMFKADIKESFSFALSLLYRLFEIEK